MEGLLCLRLASQPKPTIHPAAPRVSLLKQESTALPDPPGPLLWEKNSTPGTSLPVQWLRLHASTAGGMDSIPDQGTKSPHGTWGNQEKKKIQPPSKASEALRGLELSSPNSHCLLEL